MTPLGKYPETVTMTTAKIAFTNAKFPEGKSSADNNVLKEVELNSISDIEKYVLDFIRECRELHAEPNIVKHFILEFVYSAISMSRKNGEQGYASNGTRI